MDATPLLTGQGTAHTQAFALGTTTQLVFRLATDFATQAAIIEASQYTAFTSGQAFSGFAVFNGGDGYKSVTLAPGAYYVAVRNSGAGANSVRYELDRRASLSDGVLQDYYKTTATTLTPGQRRWDPFTIQSGIRYWIDGCNSGLDAFVIAASELANFQSGGAFLHFSDYGDVNSPDLYGGIELQLNPGSYYLVQRNTSSTPKSINYVMERWTGVASATLGAHLAPDELVPDAAMPVGALPADGDGRVRRDLDFVGSGCSSHPAGTPVLAASWLQLPEGATLRIGVSNAAAEAPALLVVGLHAATPLLLDFDNGCWLYPSPDAVVPVSTSGAGDANTTFGVPPGWASDDGSLFLQWVVPDVGTANGRGPAMSDAWRIGLERSAAQPR